MITSIITVVAFLFNIATYDIAWAVRSTSESSHVGSDRAGGPGAVYSQKLNVNGPFKDLNVDTFSVPQYLGYVKEKKRLDTGKTVIHIQDAHCNYAAQNKISDIIGYLTRSYGVTDLNLEGGSGAYDLSLFTSIADQKVREKVADNFVKEGLVSGAEYYAINNPDKVNIWGVEDAKLYMENLQVYRDSLQYKERVDRYLKSLSHILNNLKMHIYSEELLEVDLKYTKYKADELAFKDYLGFLLQKAKEKLINIKSFTNIYLLNQTLEQERIINFKKANDERDSLVDRLQKVLSKRELEELVVKTLEFKTETISQEDFYVYLLKKANSANLALKDYPELQKYIVYIALYNKIDKPRTFQEMDSLEAQIKAFLFQNDKQKELNTLSKNLALLKNIFAITITKEDYSYFTQSRDSFDVRNFTAFIEKEAPLYKIIASVDKDIAELDRRRDDISRFFECSLKRDDAFLKNLKFPESEKKLAVIVTGGFHTENLMGLFEKNGISYVSITPNFKNEDNYECPYFKLLAGELTGLQKRIYSALYTPGVSMMQVASVWNELGIGADPLRAELSRIALIAQERLLASPQATASMAIAVNMNGREGWVVFEKTAGGNVDCVFTTESPDQAVDLINGQGQADSAPSLLNALLLASANIGAKYPQTTYAGILLDYLTDLRNEGKDPILYHRIIRLINASLLPNDPIRRQNLLPHTGGLNDSEIFLAYEGLSHFSIERAKEILDKALEGNEEVKKGYKTALNELEAAIKNRARLHLGEHRFVACVACHVQNKVREATDLLDHSATVREIRPDMAEAYKKARNEYENATNPEETAFAKAIKFMKEEGDRKFVKEVMESMEKDPMRVAYAIDNIILNSQQIGMGSEGLAHFQAILKTNSPFYAEFMTLGNTIVAPDEFVGVAKDAYKLAHDMLNTEPREFFLNYHGKRKTFWVLNTGEINGVQIGNIYLDMEIIVGLGFKGLASERGKVLELIKNAIMIRGPDKFRNIGAPLVIAALDKSQNLFEDHAKNGFIGINKGVFAIQDIKIRQMAFQIGVTHEFRHEAGETNETLLTTEDADLSILLANQDVMLVQRLRESLLGLVTDDSPFIKEFGDLVGRVLNEQGLIDRIKSLAGIGLPAQQARLTIWKDVGCDEKRLIELIDRAFPNNPDQRDKILHTFFLHTFWVEKRNGEPPEYIHISRTAPPIIDMQALLGSKVGLEGRGFYGFKLVGSEKDGYLVVERDADINEPNKIVNVVLGANARQGEEGISVPVIIKLKAKEFKKFLDNFNNGLDINDQVKEKNIWVESNDARNTHGYQAVLFEKLGYIPSNCFDMYIPKFALESGRYGDLFGLLVERQEDMFEKDDKGNVRYENGRPKVKYGDGSILSLQRDRDGKPTGWVKLDPTAISPIPDLSRMLDRTKEIAEPGGLLDKITKTLNEGENSVANMLKDFLKNHGFEDLDVKLVSVGSTSRGTFDTSNPDFDFSVVISGKEAEDAKKMLKNIELEREWRRLLNQKAGVLCEEIQNKIGSFYINGSRNLTFSARRGNYAIVGATQKTKLPIEFAIKDKNYTRRVGGIDITMFDTDKDISYPAYFEYQLDTMVGTDSEMKDLFKQEVRRLKRLFLELGIYKRGRKAKEAFSGVMLEQLLLKVAPRDNLTAEGFLSAINKLHQESAGNLRTFRNILESRIASIDGMAEDDILKFANLPSDLAATLNAPSDENMRILIEMGRSIVERYTPRAEPVTAIAPAGASLIGKLVDDAGNVVTECQASREGDDLVVTYDRSPGVSAEVRVKIANNISEVNKDDIKLLMGIGGLDTLPAGIGGYVRTVLDQLGDLEDIIAMENNENVLAAIGQDKKTVFLNAALVADLDEVIKMIKQSGESQVTLEALNSKNPTIGSKLMGVLHELGEGFSKIPDGYKDLTKHTLWRGGGKDARNAFHAAAATDPKLNDLTDANEMIVALEEKMREPGFVMSKERNLRIQRGERPLTDSEKDLIKRNATMKDADGNPLKGIQLLYGIQDHLDPAGNIRFTQTVRTVVKDIRQGVLNIFLIPRSSILGADAPMASVASGARNTFDKKYGNNTIVRFYDDASFEEMLKEAAKEAEKSENKDRMPKILVYCMTEAQKSNADSYLKENRSYENMIMIGDDVPRGDEAVVNIVDEVKVITVGAVLMTDKRLKDLKESGIKIDEGEFLESRKRLIRFLANNEIIDEVAVADDAIDGYLEDIWKGIRPIKISRVNWESLRDWKNSQDEVLRAL